VSFALSFSCISYTELYPICSPANTRLRAPRSRGVARPKCVVMSSATAPASLFISAEAVIDSLDAYLLKTDSDASCSVRLSGSSGSSVVDLAVQAAVDAIPAQGLLPPHEAVWVDDGNEAGPPTPPGLDVLQPDAHKRRSGGLAGMGGRREGTGLRTRENFPRGALRVLASAMHLHGVSSLLEDVDCLLGVVTPTTRTAFIELVDSWRQASGKEEIWSIPYLFGVFARYSVWGKTDRGKRSASCTWVSEDGFVRCTCAGSDVYNSDVAVGRASACEHVELMDWALCRMAEALCAPKAAVSTFLCSALSHRGKAVSDGDALVDEEAPVWRFHKDVVVVVSVQRGVTVPVPVNLPKKGVSCGFCPLSNLSGCSHTKVAEQYRSASGSPMPQAPSSTGVRSSVSTLPLSLFNCPSAIALDRRIGELARLGGTYLLEAPAVCTFCEADMSAAPHDRDTSHSGIVHSTLGPCAMRVVRRQCSSCFQLCSRDGRSEQLILLSLTSSCTVTWARKCAEFVRSGTNISDVLTQCYSDWAGLKAAGLLPASIKPRGADTLRALILAVMRLCVAAPDKGLYDCRACQLPCGRYQVVTSDCICLGFDAASQPFSFEHVCEAVPAMNTKGREGCLVVGEQARRMLRHVLVPGDPPDVTDRTLPSAELALSCLFPVLPAEGVSASSTPASNSIRKLLGMVWKIEAAALPMAESLLRAFETTKVKPLKERRRRAECAIRLKASIEIWRKAHPEAVAKYSAAIGQHRAALATAEGAAAASPAALAAASHRRDMTSASARRRRRRQGRGAAADKEPVKPGEEPALEIPKPLLQPLLLGLDDNDVDHICRMVLAFTLDPVVAGVKVRHFQGLLDVARALRSPQPRQAVEALVAQATSRSRVGPASQAADCLRELRHVMVALQAAALVFDASHDFAAAIADVFFEAVSAARAFYGELAADVAPKHEYMTRYLQEDAQDDHLLEAFKARYPLAATSPSATGVYTPGRDQCRAEPFAAGDTTSCGTCEKGYNSSDKYSDGALTLCCACAHPKILGFVVLDRKESPQVLINALLTRFPRLPRYLIYDFACGVVRCAMAKLPWMLRDLSVVSDRFHVCNHTCSHFYNANSYGDLDYKNTLTHEQRNAAIRKMESILRGAGRYGYLALLSYQTSVLNSFAESRSAYQQAALDAAEA